MSSLCSCPEQVENILQGSDGKWKICDFGSCVSRARAYENKSEIAREEVRRQPSPASQRGHQLANDTRTQDVIARTTTAQYRAPEMCDLYVAAA